MRSFLGKISSSRNLKFSKKGTIFSVVSVRCCTKLCASYHKFTFNSFQILFFLSWGKLETFFLHFFSLFLAHFFIEFFRSFLKSFLIFYTNLFEIFFLQFYSDFFLQFFTNFVANKKNRHCFFFIFSF